MVNIFANFWISFLAGVFAPVAAVCVLPLYPAFLAYLSNKISVREPKKTIVLLGLIVAVGIISSMLLVGFIFTGILEASLTKATGIISPIAFIVLILVSLLLIFNIDFGKFFPRINAPLSENPLLSSFFFGFFFGVIVLPCNPASLIILFAISASTIGFLENFLNFLFFGIGMSLPLIVLSVISATSSQTVINFLGKYKRIINLLAGLIMLTISLYYLLFVFKIFG